MLIILPLVSTELRFAQRLLAVWRGYGPFTGHRLLMVHGPGQAAFAQEVRAEVGELFKEVAILPCPITPVSGPAREEFKSVVERNSLWMGLMMGLDPKMNERCFLWHDLSTLPMVPDAYDRLEEAHKASLKPIMGTIVKAPTGKVEYVHRCAVFPLAMASLSNLWKTCAESGTVNFALYLRVPIAKNSSPTPLIAASLGARNCRRAATGSDIEADGLLEGTTELLSLNAVLVAGVLDDSIGDFLPSPKKPVEVPVPEKPKAAETLPVVDKPKVVEPAPAASPPVPEPAPAAQPGSPLAAGTGLEPVGPAPVPQTEGAPAAITEPPAAPAESPAPAPVPQKSVTPPPVQPTFARRPTPPPAKS